MSKVFLDPCFIFEINVNSQNLLHDWCYFTYMFFSKVTQCKSCSRKMCYACVCLHFPWQSVLWEGTYAPGERRWFKGSWIWSPETSVLLPLLPFHSRSSSSVLLLPLICGFLLQKKRTNIILAHVSHSYSLIVYAGGWYFSPYYVSNPVIGIGTAALNK